MKWRRGIDVYGFSGYARGGKFVGCEESIENSSFILMDLPVYYVKIFYEGRFDFQHNFVLEFSQLG